MSIKQRILDYIRYKNLTPGGFEKHAGLSNAYISNIRKSISDAKLEQITNAFPDINPTWLRMGVGNMLNQEETPMVREPEAEYIKPKFNFIPLISAEAIAGVASGEVQAMDYEAQAFVIPPFSGADFIIPVRGDSMSPRYMHGDLVACKRIRIDAFFQWDKIYVLDTDQGPLIKRISTGVDESNILLVSENMAYKPQLLHKQHIRSLSVVIGVVRME